MSMPTVTIFEFNLQGRPLSKEVEGDISITKTTPFNINVFEFKVSKISFSMNKNQLAKRVTLELKQKVAADEITLINLLKENQWNDGNSPL